MYLKSACESETLLRVEWSFNYDFAPLEIRSVNWCWQTVMNRN